MTYRVGGGASLFFGSYKPDNGLDSGSAGAGPGLEIRALGEVDYQTSERGALVGQLGLSLLVIGGGEISAEPEYTEGIGQGIPMLSLGVGYKTELRSGRTIMFMYRMGVWSLDGAWTDYTIGGWEPYDYGTTSNMIQFYYYFR